MLSGACGSRLRVPLRHYPYMAGSDSGLTETSLRHRLKRETAAAHRHLEAQLGLLDATLDVHRYRRVLETFYGFYAPVEIDLARLTAAELPLGFPLRARAELIERDLLALGLSPAEIVALPLCSERPELSCSRILPALFTCSKARVSEDRFSPRCCTADSASPKRAVLRSSPAMGSGRCQGGPS